MTKEIPLTQGRVAIVDDSDFEFLNNWSWYFHKRGYATRMNSKGKMFYMHREIMNPPSGVQTDHINGNKLDNRRENLRLCNNAENMRNRGKNSNNTSGKKGVSFHKHAKKWVAQIVVNGKHIPLGYYNTPEEAGKAYDAACIAYHGEFSRINTDA